MQTSTNTNQLYSLSMMMPFRHLQASLGILLVKIKGIMSGQSSNPSHLTLYPENTLDDSIRTWCGNAVVAENVGYARDAQVLRVVHTKSKQGKSHEDIRFEILAEGKTGWILTDRNAGSSGSSSPSSSPSASNADLTASGSPVAFDRIIIPTYGFPAVIDTRIKNVHATVCSYQISPATPLSLAELAGLLPLVSDQSKHYDPFSKQCYWYARAVYESIKRRYQILDEVLGEAYSSRGKHAKLPIPCSVSADVLEKIGTAWSTRIEQISEVKTISEVRPKLEHRLNDDYADLNG